MLYALAVFAPLAGALVSGLLGRAIGDKAAMGASILGMVIAAICGPLAFFQLTGGADPGVLDLGTWIEAGRFHVEWALRYDTLSAVMVAMVSFVSMLIHVYSIGYMGHDARPRYRFFAYLSLFTFAMLMLVTADNLAQLFFGWEGVGLCSYLLIGYWYDRPSACAAAIKAFVVNRIADLPFAVGLALIFFKFGSIEFAVIFPAVAQHAADTYALFGTTFPAIEVIGFLLFIGAMGKSAQLGFHVWLPDAMEGPTPVSALIHAATMVTAGVFLMARMSPLMEYAPDGAGVRHLHRRLDRAVRRDDRLRAERHQAGDRLFDLLAAWLHVRRRRRRRLSGLDLPSDHPRLLQGAAVPVRRLGHPRDVRRAGHAEDGRAGESHPGHLHGDVDRQPGAGRHPAVRRLVFQGRDHLGHLRCRHRDRACMPSSAPCWRRS